MPVPTYSDFLDSWDGFVTEVPPLKDQLEEFIAYAEGLQGRPLSVSEQTTFYMSQLGLVFATSRQRGLRASLGLLASRLRRSLHLPKPVPANSKPSTPRLHPTSLAPGMWLL